MTAGVVVEMSAQTASSVLAMGFHQRIFSSTIINTAMILAQLLSPIPMKNCTLLDKER
jgi:hypothetical protein